VADEIARARMPVIVQSFDNLPDTFERLGATMANAARLQRAGVQVALASFDAQQNVRLMNQFAGNLLSLGGADAMNEAQALSLITSAPAQILGLTDIGNIAAGKTADVVLWDGPPLEPMSAPVAVMIGGVSQPMVSRQTLLRDRYKSMTGETPYQYRK
jgi:imidazolonepropionase-like amidohydrolase